MAIRRFREHAAKQNWFAVAIDVLIVFLGVFLGMQVNVWNQARLDRAEGRANREMLIADLRANQTNLAMRRHYYEWVRAEALKTSDALAGRRSSTDEQFLIDAYQASQILPWSLKRNTYDQIIARGTIEHVGDAVLRDRISNYYVGADVTGANLGSFPPYRETLRRVMPYAVQLRVRTDCGEKIGENSRGEADMVLPGDCHIRLDAEAIRQAAGQVRGTPGLSLDLNRLLVDLDQKLVSVDVISRRAGILAQALKDAS